MTPKEVSDRILVLTTEHTASRSEILQLSTKQQQLLIASFAVTAYAFTELTLKKAAPPAPAPPPYAWLVISIVLSALDLLYVNCDLAIIRCATYIEGFLKVEITRLLIGPDDAYDPDVHPTDPHDSEAALTDPYIKDPYNTRIDLAPNSSQKLQNVDGIAKLLKRRHDKPSLNEAQACRLLEWEAYIRGHPIDGKQRDHKGDGHLRPHLTNYIHRPHSAQTHSLLIFIPAVFCWARFTFEIVTPIWPY